MLGRRNTWSRICRTGTGRRSDIITKQVNGGLLSLYGRLAGCRHTLRCRALYLCLFLYNRKRLVGQFYPALHSNLDESYLIVIEGRRIGHTPIHNPSLGLVLGANEIFNFPVIISISGESSKQSTASLTLRKEHDQVQVSTPNICDRQQMQSHNTTNGKTNLFALAFPHFRTL